MEGTPSLVAHGWNTAALLLIALLIERQFIFTTMELSRVITKHTGY